MYVIPKLKHLDALNTLYILELYVNGLIIQWNKIMVEMQDYWDNNDNYSAVEVLRRSNLLFLDIHYYVICWDKIGKNVDRLKRITTDRNLHLACKKFKPILERISSIRNYYEHLDEQSIQARRYSFKNDQLTLRYFRKNENVQHSITLGRKELDNLLVAFEGIVETFKNMP
jgi:hypothetical protein